jgi:addiction module RelB/DinJ family antitoxin
MKEPLPIKPASTLFRARVDSDHFSQAKEVLGRIGLKPGDAVNLFFAQIALRSDLPFAVTTQPNRLQTDENQAEAWNEALGDY